MAIDQARTGLLQADQPPSWGRFQLAGTTPEAYERYLVPVLFAPCAEQLIELAAPGPGERVLDVACGTGIVARRAAARVGAGGAVAGLDLNEGMLQVARTVGAEAHPAIDWQAGDAADLPLPDGAFDAVFCQQGLQFFPDRVAALGEMRRVLVPGGRLALAVWRPIQHSPGFAALAELLERHAGAEAAAMLQAPFAAPDAARLRQLVVGADFDGVRIRIGIVTVRFASPEEFLRHEAASSPLAGPVQALAADVRGALVRDLGQALLAHTDDDGVVFPIETWLITARR